MTTTDHTERLASLLASLPVGKEFTDALCAGATRGRVSAVVATYNRCPFDPAGGRLRDNPLTWALDTLLDQAGHSLAEIVVVDDGSTDHTAAVLNQITEAARIPIRVIRLGRHAGSASARNAGAAAATGQWLLFGDDDCLYPPYYAAGAAYLMHMLTRRDPATAAVMLPFYYRALRPREVLPATRIGRLEPDVARFATGFHAMPAGHLAGTARLDDYAGLLAPLRVDLIGGTALIDAAALDRSGGFTDLSAWAMSYSDHLHLAADLTDTGGHLYHCPDPRLAAVHLKFGAAGRFPVHPDDLTTPLPTLGRPFGELVELSAVRRTDTGCRVTDEDFHAEMIGAFFEFFAGRSESGGVAWGVRTWREFVETGEAYSLSVAAVPGRRQREAAWRNGLARGARFLTTAARPGRTRAQVERVLAQIGAATRTPVLSPWAGSGG
ncbi:MAG TPA: glycosyltransferase [Mycobacteriales bacterium]|nr:glycosyltransferase [Mycobacteriales bacterium]